MRIAKFTALSYIVNRSKIMKTICSFCGILMLIFLSFHSFAQPSKGAADAHFNDQNYEIALTKHYLKLYRHDKTNPLYNERIGLCYLFLDDDKTLSIPYLKFVDTLKYRDPLISLYLGEAYFYAANYDKAEKKINQYLEEAKEIPEDKNREANNYLKYIKNSRILMNQPLDVSFENMGDNINSKRSEFYPFVTPDGNLLFFSSNRKYISDFEILVKNSYYCKSEYGNWSKAKSLGSRINTEEDEQIVGIDYDGEYVLVFANTIDAEFDILISRSYRGRYREAESIGKNINTPDIEMGAWLTENEDTLYFASNREGGLGGMDIYYSVKLPDGEYGLPVNIGEPINTPDDENFPRISREGNKMFFASSGHNSMGGYDIFTTTFDKITGKWSQPVNFGYPINNSYDNETITFSEDKRYAYLSAYRKDSYGYRDLYKVIFNDVDAVRVVFT